MMLDPASTTISLLHPGEVHLWWYASPAIAPRVRRTYIDAVLRITLSRYVAMPPQALRFGRESRGRPFLLDVDGAPDFNLSDTEGGTVVADTEGGTVVAVARGLRVGIDLERMDRQPRVQALAKRYFGKDEATALASLEAARRAFLFAWTAKESSCKATGTGIYGWLDQWTFACDAIGSDPQLTQVPNDATPLAAWQHRRVAPAEGYTAVLAAKGSIAQCSPQKEALAAFPCTARTRPRPSRPGPSIGFSRNSPDVLRRAQEWRMAPPRRRCKHAIGPGTCAAPRRRD